MHRLEAEVGGRGDRATGQQGVGELEQGVGAALQAGVEALTEVAQCAEWRVLSVHAAKCATTAAHVATPPAAYLPRGLNARLEGTCQARRPRRFYPISGIGLSLISCIRGGCAGNAARAAPGFR